MSKPRQLGFWMCLALVVGNVVGSGVFLLPASLAPYGVNSIFGWLFTAVGALFLAAVFAQLARVYPQAGGPYVYPRVAFGEFAGFLVAWGYWMSVWVGNAAVAIGTVAYLSELVPAIRTTVGAPAVTSVAMIWLLTLLNCLGVKHAGVMQVVTTVLKLLPLVAIIALAAVLFFAGDASVIKAEPAPFSVSAMTASATLTLWALLGLESATVPAENVIDPQRTIPRATLWGTLLAAVIYVIACSTIVLLVPSAQLAQSNAPFADVLRTFWGDEAADLLALFAFISGFGALNGWILIQGQMPQVLARDRIFPAVFARESRRGTPAHALVISSALATPLILMNYSSTMVQIFTFVALVSIAAFLVMYLFCSLAALKLAWRGDLGLQGRRLRWVLAVATIAALYSIWTLFGAGAEAVWWNLLLFAAGVPVYFAMKFARRARASESDG